jgi:ribosomal protein S6
MKITKEEFLSYYEQGLKDSEIARISGDAESCVNKFRNSLGLPVNGRKIISDEDFFELYYKGYSDAEIAKISGASSSQIGRRRLKYDLPVNKKKHPLDDNFMDLYNSGNNDSEISRLTGISLSVVRNYRVKLNLPVIKKSELNKETIKELFNSNKSDEEIGEVLGLSSATVKKQRQSIGLLRANKRPNNYIYSNEEFQIILGSLLGDGSLQKTYTSGGTVFKVTHCEKQKEYIEYKWNFLKNNSSEIKEYTFHDDRRKNPDYISYTFYTKSSLSLNEMFNNWYRPNKTIYKEDLYKIEPLGIAIWYMDDGYKCKPYGGGMLCTNLFSKQELEIIQQMFKDKFDINVTINNQSNNLVYIPSSEFSKFKELIEPYVIDSMKYKLE